MPTVPTLNLETKFQIRDLQYKAYFLREQAKAHEQAVVTLMEKIKDELHIDPAVHAFDLTKLEFFPIQP